MKNSYTTLHRNLDNRILTLEKETHPNQTLITDLKKQKLKLSDRMSSITIDEFTVTEKKRAKKLVDSMIHDQKRSDKKRRKSRKKRIQYAVRVDKVSLSG